MDELAKKRIITGKQIFNEVIKMKKITGAKTKDICNVLEENEEAVSDYFLGNSKENLPLGIRILDYLEEREKTDKNAGNSKIKSIK